MLVIRPITANDYPALMKCAEESGYGFTSLPVNEDILRNKISHAEQCFAKTTASPIPAVYLMVAEDTETGEVAGTTAIETVVGLDTPFYNYQLSNVVHASRRLGIHNTVKVLTFGNQYTGDTELCTLFLRPQWRQGLNGRLMSKSRFLMMAEHQERFSDVIFAEMRGVVDEDGNSPFWQWLKDNFFSIDFSHADYLTGIGAKGFIADLMPKLPIYVSLLSPEAQAVIGEVHQDTRPALRLLEKEGFSCRGYVDIFDAGPTVECDLRNIETVRHSKRCTVEIADHNSEQNYLVTNTLFDDFRAVATPLAVDDERNVAVMNQYVADILKVKAGDSVRLIAQ